MFAFITKFLLYAKIRFVLLFGSIYQYFTVLPGFVVKNNCSIPFTAMGKISRDCGKDVTSGKVEAHTLLTVPLSERICVKLVQWSTSSLDRLIRKEDYVGLPTEFYWSRS